MGESQSERSTGSIPFFTLEAVDKSASSTSNGRKAMEQDLNGNAVEVNKEQKTKVVSKPSDLNSTASEVHAGTRSPSKNVVPASKSGDSSGSVANGFHLSQKSTIENPLGTDDYSPRTTTTTTSASALAMPTLASTITDTGLVSSASNNTVDCNDTHTNESIATPPEQQSRLSKNMYCDSQETSQSQMVVTVPQQDTVYYQIPQLPSVVTLPAESSQDVVPKPNDEIDQQESIEQQQIHQITVAQSHLPIQTEDQIIGMVGAVPIIKMQGGGTHYVKEKKGRFNLLQTTPVIPSVVGVTSSTSSTSQPQVEESRSSTVVLVSNSSNSRSQSPAPVVNASVPAAPQTFDGKSAPTVKRKGRFVVTNVKDPGSIIQIQTKSVPGVAVVASTDTTVTSSQQDQTQQQQPPQPQQKEQQTQTQTQSQPIQPQQIQAHVQQPVQKPAQQPVQPSNQHQQSSPLQTPLQNPPIPIVEQTYQQSNVSQIPLQSVVIQPVSTMQQTYAIPQQYQQNYVQHPVTTSSQVPVQHYSQNLQPQTVQYASVHPQNRQPNYVQYVPQVQHTVYASNPPTHSTGQPISVAVPHGQQVVYNQQYQQQIPQQHYSPRQSYVQTQQIQPAPSFPVNPQPVSQTRYTPTPPTTPGGSTSSPMQSRPAATSTLPNAPIPKPTTTNLEKQLSTKGATKKKTTTNGKSGKVPQSFDSNGTGSSIGFGRVFYLLDQMKTEVTDADQCMKTLQTDMKLLRDKNKELEAKNKELESKLREEQALREKTEIRSMDLRKKLREAKDEIKALKLVPAKAPKDESENDKVSNPNSVGKEAKTTLTGKIPQQTKTVSGASPKRNGTATDGTLKTGSSHSQLASTSPKVNDMNGSSLNIPNIDLNLKEQPELKNATDTNGRRTKPRSVSKGSEMRRAVSMEYSTGTRSAREKVDASHQRVESMHTLGTPPLVPPARSHSTNGTKSPGHKHTQSLHDFDPLKSTVPVLSFQTFETVPIKTATTSESVPLPQYMSQSGVMMPVSFGVSPTAVSTTNGGFQRSPPPMAERQTLVANNYQGLHEQQFMVVPQQQQIVFNQMAYPTQQRSSAVQNHQYTSGSLQQQNVQHQSLRGHVQQPTQQHATQQSYTSSSSSSANPFDPLS